MTMIKAGKLLFVLSAATLMLPWFTYDARIMGYCWGCEFIIYFIPPMILTGVSLFANRRNGALSAAGVVGAGMNIGVLIFALGMWHQKHNILSGFRPDLGIRTAVFGFWIGAFSFASLLMVTVICLFQNASTDIRRKEGA